jgi:drug/metabolite transporter (DMT)-like permease
MSGPRHRIGMLSASLAALCWGAATVLSKVALEQVTPVTLLVAQLGASVVLLWAVAVAWRIPVGRARDIVRYAWLGLLEPGLAYLLGLIGLTDLTAGGATLIQSSEAILIVAVSALLLRERTAPRIVLLSVVALLGLVPAIGSFDAGAVAGNGPFGITLMFVATATAAFYVVMSSRIASQTNPIVIVAWQQTVAFAFAALLLPMEGLLVGPGAAAATQHSLALWAVVIVSGVIQYALAFSLYMHALSNIRANVAGTFLNLTPVFGVAIAYVCLHESLSLLQLIGAAVTIAAVMLISRSAPAGSH